MDPGLEVRDLVEFWIVASELNWNVDIYWSVA